MRIDENTNRFLQWFPQVMKAHQLLLIHQFVTLAKTLIILLKIYTLNWSNICTYFSILKFSLILPNICIVPKHSRSRNYHKHISQKYWPTYWPSLLTIFGIFWCIFFLFTILLLSILHTIFHFQFCSFLLKVYFVLKLLYRSIDM